MGEFEHSCRFCGALIEPEVVLVNEVRRVRYLVRGQHECPDPDNTQQMRSARALNTLMVALDNPDDYRVRRIQQDAHLPQRFHAGLHRLQRTDENEAAIAAANRMVERFQERERGRGLYLWGPIGTGKSAISKALAFDLIHRTGRHTPLGWTRPLVTWGERATAQWWFVGRLFHEMGKHFGGKPSEYDPETLERCECLVLDDLGKEHPTDFRRAELFRLINDRYDRERALVVTSNYAPAELAVRMIGAYGLEAETEIMAIFDRLQEVCEVVEVAGESWRQQAA